MATPEQEALQRVASDPRRQWGWGPSALASPEEQRAYEAYQMIPEIQAGRASVADLPEEYGGRPRITAGPSYNEQGQPVGAFRRQLRMQEMYNEEQKQALEQQRIMQQMEQAARQEQMFQLDYASKQYDLRTKQNEALFSAQEDADRRAAEAAFTEFRNKLNPNDPSSVGILAGYIAGDSRLAESPIAKNSYDYFAKASENSAVSINAKMREEAQNKYAEDMQKLMETGVTEEELPQYYDPDSPIGMPQFDRRKVAARIGGVKAQEKAEAKTTKEETPKEKIGLDLQQAYGELNALVLGEEGADTASAQSKVAGLRARYKAATGQEAPEVPFQPKSREEYDRVPSGRPYIGQDGKTRIKQ